ncbi:Pyridoxal phosphate (PLP)-dependent transferase superfamily protein [Zea mays]|nr:Pyridoxal phosphate (PLP)-dependent transferase superfamily protein [Zea mays]
MPERSIPREAAQQIISDELMLDGNPRLNLASFVTTWMEPECDKLIMDSINKNYVDMDEYPVTTELQNRCVNMIAHLFNAPIKEDETAIGVGTVGSSEAIMLAGLAFKRKWQNKRKEQGKPCDRPNIVTGANVQVCWEKFARYFEVELKEVKLSEGYYVMDPVKAVEMVDENTICVAAILGSTLTGEFEDVKQLNDLLTEKNKETGWDVPIHVDAASGGFIAPFLYPELEWDFRLPLVKSINVSGHKYGLVYPGVGWVIWRSKDDLPEELIFHINYLGTDQPTFTLNFSKGSCQIIAQYYQLIRLGFEVLLFFDRFFLLLIEHSEYICAGEQKGVLSDTFLEGESFLFLFSLCAAVTASQSGRVFFFWCRFYLVCRGTETSWRTARRTRRYCGRASRRRAGSTSCPRTPGCRWWPSRSGTAAGSACSTSPRTCGGSAGSCRRTRCRPTRSTWRCSESSSGRTSAAASPNGWSRTSARSCASWTRARPTP